MVSSAVPVPVVCRALAPGDWDAVRRIYAEGIDTGHATFETVVPEVDVLDGKWLVGQRWVAVVDDEVVGWASVTPVSPRDCYRGVGETSVYVAASHHGRGVGTALVRQQVTAADAAGFWTLQTSVFPENVASLALHGSTGFRRVGTRERIAQLDGVWRDTVFLERRRRD